MVDLFFFVLCLPREGGKQKKTYGAAKGLFAERRVNWKKKTAKTYYSYHKKKKNRTHKRETEKGKGKKEEEKKSQNGQTLLLR